MLPPGRDGVSRLGGGKRHALRHWWQWVQVQVLCRPRSVSYRCTNDHDQTTVCIFFFRTFCLNCFFHGFQLFALKPGVYGFMKKLLFILFISFPSKCFFQYLRRKINADVQIIIRAFLFFFIRKRYFSQI